MSDEPVRTATDEETATFVPHLLLVDRFEVLTTLVAQEGGSPRLAIHVHLEGRENKTQARRSQNFVLGPEDMAAFVRTVSESYQHAVSRPRDSFGRPQ